MSQYIFHFPVDYEDVAYRLTCCNFVHTISKHWRGKLAQPTKSADYNSDNLVIPGDSDDPPYREVTAGSDLFDDRFWAHVALLQWTLRSDGIITVDMVTRRLADLRAAGQLESIKEAFIHLTEALNTDEFPALDGLSSRDLVQLVALGRDLCLAATSSWDLLTFAKNEFQNIDLAIALRV